MLWFSCRRVSDVMWVAVGGSLVLCVCIRLANCQNLFGKIDSLFSSIRKN